MAQNFDDPLAPDFDRIARGSNRATRDAIFLLWASLQEEKRRRTARARDLVASVPLGGDEDFFQTDASYARVKQAAIVRLNGLTYRAADVFFDARVDAGTGSVRLWNLSTSTSMGSVSVTATSNTFHSITGLVPTAGTNDYELQAQKGTTWIIVFGAVLQYSQE